MGVVLTDGYGPRINGLPQYQGALHGKKVWYVSPVYDQAEDLIALLIDWFPFAHFNRGKRKLTFPGGGSIAFKTSKQAKNLRGRGLGGVVVDEAAFVEPNTYLRGLAPTLTEQKGWSFVCSSPDGQGDNLLWRIEESILKGNLKDWTVFVYHTKDNPIIDPAEIEEKRQLLGETSYRQEYLAEYVNPEDALFNAEWLTDERMLVDQIPDKYIKHFISIDPALGVGLKGDYAVITYIAYLDGKFWCDVDAVRRNPEVLFQDAKIMWQKYGNPPIVFETSCFQHIMADQFFGRYGIPAEFAYKQDHAGQNKKKRILRLAPYLSRNEIKILRSPSAQLALEQFRGFPNPKVHDDIPDAIEQGILALFEC